MDALLPLNGQQLQAQIVISMTTEGLVHVSGPIANKLLCYGLLKLAEETITKHQVNESPIIAPRLSLG